MISAELKHGLIECLRVLARGEVAGVLDPERSAVKSIVQETLRIGAVAEVLEKFEP